MKKPLIILAFLLTAMTLVTGRLQAAGGITSVITLPEGTNGEVQFGKNGRFRGDADFTFSTSTNRVTVSSAAITYATVSTASVTQLQFSDGTNMTSAASGGDNLGTHIATKTISAPYGISATTIAASGVSLTYGVGAATGVFTGALSADSVTDSGLSSGRVTYAGTGGLLQDSSDFTFNGTTLAATGVSASTAAVTKLNFADGTTLTSTSDIASRANVNTFTSSATFNGTVAISSGLVLGGSAGTSGQVFTSAGTGGVPTWSTLGAMAMTKLYDSTLVSDSSFTITSISGSYDALKILLWARSDNVSNGLFMKLNGDSSLTTATYIYSLSTSVSSERNTTLQVAYLPYPVDSPTDGFGYYVFELPRYADVTIKKNITYQFGTYYSVNNMPGVGFVEYNSTNTITSVQFYNSGHNLLTGSRCIVYGYNY